MIWQEARGKSRLAAVERNGRVAALTSDDFPAIAVLQPAPFALRQSVLGPALGGALCALAVFALSWPIGAAYRHRYGGEFALRGAAAAAYRMARLGAVANVVFIALWLPLVLGALGDTAGHVSGMDVWFRGLQLVALLGFLGAAAAIADLVRIWRDPSHGWWARSSGVLVVVAMAIVIWTQISVRAFNPSLIY